mgnify:FL=1
MNINGKIVGKADLSNNNLPIGKPSEKSVSSEHPSSKASEKSSRTTSKSPRDLSPQDLATSTNLPTQKELKNEKKEPEVAESPLDVMDSGWMNSVFPKQPVTEESDSCPPNFYFFDPWNQAISQTTEKQSENTWGYFGNKQVVSKIFEKKADSTTNKLWADIQKKEKEVTSKIADYIKNLLKVIDENEKKSQCEDLFPPGLTPSKLLKEVGAQEINQFFPQVVNAYSPANSNYNKAFPQLAPIGGKTMNDNGYNRKPHYPQMQMNQSFFNYKNSPTQGGQPTPKNFNPNYQFTNYL